VHGLVLCGSGAHHSKISVTNFGGHMEERNQLVVDVLRDTTTTTTATRDVQYVCDVDALALYLERKIGHHGLLIRQHIPYPLPHPQQPSLSRTCTHKDARIYSHTENIYVYTHTYTHTHTYTYMHTVTQRNSSSFLVQFNNSLPNTKHLFNKKNHTTRHHYNTRKYKYKYNEYTHKHTHTHDSACRSTHIKHC
jgi:hypothetical protein